MSSLKTTEDWQAVVRFLLKEIDNVTRESENGHVPSTSSLKRLRQTQLRTEELVHKIYDWNYQTSG